MASKQQITGMLGVYLTAVELVRRGFIVSPTSRSAMGADLLVTDQKCQRAWSVQVKTNASSASFWLLGHHALELASDTHVYVFVSAPPPSKRTPDGRPSRFFVVQSNFVAKAIIKKTSSTGSIWYEFRPTKEHEGMWGIFGDPEGPSPENA